MLVFNNVFSQWHQIHLLEEFDSFEIRGDFRYSPNFILHIQYTLVIHVDMCAYQHVKLSMCTENAGEEKEQSPGRLGEKYGLYGEHIDEGTYIYRDIQAKMRLLMYNFTCVDVLKGGSYGSHCLNIWTHKKHSFCSLHSVPYIFNNSSSKTKQNKTRVEI